jgi:hypothetical protein
MTTVDLDVNRCMARNKRLLAVLLLLWFGYYAPFIVQGLVPEMDELSGSSSISFLVWIPCMCPSFFYIFFRYNEILDFHKGYPAMSQMITTILMGDLVGGGLSIALSELHPKKLEYRLSYYAVLTSYMIGAMAVAYAHHWSQSQNESLTMSFNTAAYAYLLAIGTGFILYMALADTVGYAKPEWGQFLVGPIHLVPTLGMFFFRRTVLLLLLPPPPPPPPPLLLPPPPPPPPPPLLPLLLPLLLSLFTHRRPSSSPTHRYTRSSARCGSAGGYRRRATRRSDSAKLRPVEAHFRRWTWPSSTEQTSTRT